MFRRVVRQRSISAKMLAGVGGFAALCFVLLGAVQVWFERRALEQGAVEAATRSVTLIRDPLAAAVWNFDERMIEIHARSLISGDAIARVQVLDANNTLLADASGPWAEPGSGVAWSVPLVMPGVAAPIGSLRVYGPSGRISDQLTKRASSAVLVELVKVMCVTLGLLVVTHLLVTRRLSSLARQLTAIDVNSEIKDGLAIDTGTSQGDEIGVLTHAIDRFLRNQAEMTQMRREREAASAASRAQNEFLSRMSHELRTPLNAIVGFAQLLEHDQDLLPRHRRGVQLISRAGWHLSHLIADILDLSRIEAGRMQMTMGNVDLEALAAESLAMVASDAAKDDVSVHVALSPDAMQVRADPTRLQQVLVNLLSNAVKYNRPGGSVTLWSSCVAGRVRISVTDTGLGMNEAQMAHLFEPFNRVGRQSSGKPGTGIGLVITKSLVESMGGELLVSSRCGEGSEFALTLPRCEALAPARKLAVEPPTTPCADRRRVLYVEDEPVNAELMHALLLARNIEYMNAGTLELARGLVRSWNPELILLDMQLPDGTGVELLTELRMDALLKDIPVIMVSADALCSSIQAAMRAGARAYITKPFDFQRSLREIDHALNGDQAMVIRTA